jgi:hypothetical protein
MFGETGDGLAFAVLPGLNREDVADLANALTSAAHEIISCSSSGEAPSLTGPASAGVLFLLEASRSLMVSITREEAV